MNRLRPLSLALAALIAVSGLAAGAWSLWAGAVDQAIAFTWPSIGAALAILLAAPPGDAA